MKWTEIWMKLFGTTEFMGVNVGFFVALATILLIVILMNLIFWNMKPADRNRN